MDRTVTKATLSKEELEELRQAYAHQRPVPRHLKGRVVIGGTAIAHIIVDKAPSTVRLWANQESKGERSKGSAFLQYQDVDTRRHIAAVVDDIFAWRDARRQKRYN